MRCHYEVLDVSKTSTEDEIKKAYRKLALQWHPDKNPDNIEECTKYFPVIQQAYDVLMDPQERAWYDRHRDAILKGGLDEHYKDNSLNLFPYFSSTCYSGYGDDEKGFYKVYQHVFDTIIAEDGDFEEEKDKIDKIPRFGDSKSDYETVVGPFYGYWSSYCTSKPFSWLDEYDILQAPNRRILRAMEKENQKIRSAAKKERNEEVRMLVNFVRKRDKRVQNYRKILEDQRKEQMAKVEAQRINQKLRNLKAASEYTDAIWHNVTAREDDLKEIESHFDDADKKFGNSPPQNEDQNENSENEEDDFSDQLYCVACEKNFKTKKSYENHERSKRHKDNVDLLKTQMTAEEFQLLGIEKAKNDEKNAKNGQKDGKIPKKLTKTKQKLSDFSDSSEEDEIFCQKIDEKLEINDLKNETEQNLADLDNEKLAKNEENHQNLTKIEEKQRVSSPPLEAFCSTCREKFPSRNKLFGHLKETGHAALKFGPPGPQTKQKNGAKKEKRKQKL